LCVVRYGREYCSILYCWLLLGDKLRSKDDKPGLKQLTNNQFSE